MPGPLVGLAYATAARLAAKTAAKKIAKKKVKSKVQSQAKLERTLRSENKGDARVTGRIKELKAREESGLMSAGERMRALNRMTKSQKALKAAVKKKKK